jgi:hypothetical protein
LPMVFFNSAIVVVPRKTSIMQFGTLFRRYSEAFDNISRIVFDGVPPPKIS